MKIDDEVFSASSSKSFAVELSVNRESVAARSVRDGLQHKTTNPAMFNAEPSENDLIYVFQATNGDAFIRLSEVDGDKKRRLTSPPAFDGMLSVEIRDAGATVRRALSQTNSQQRQQRH